jgi:hypothetical protein
VLDRGIDGGLYLVLVRYVCGLDEGVRAWTGSPDFCCGFIQGRLRPAEKSDPFGMGFGKGERDRSADSGVCTCDEDSFGRAVQGRLNWIVQVYSPTILDKLFQEMKCSNLLFSKTSVSKPCFGPYILL